MVRFLEGITEVKVFFERGLKLVRNFSRFFKIF